MNEQLSLIDLLPQAQAEALKRIVTRLIESGIFNE